jgi:hypothetical protein
MTRRRLLGLAVAVLVLAAVAGHVVYWYLPRSRVGSPAAGSLIDRIWQGEDYSVAVWLPYPHQNLGYLRRAAVVEEESLRAAASLAGLPAPELPPFGPLVVPPSSEMVIAADESGERYAVFAEVYPAVAAFAKLAGRLAGNPWLEGGEIYVEGRRAEVRWQGNRWAVASPGFPDLDADADAGVPAAVAPALAVIQLRQAVHPLPSGRYRLIEEGGGVELASAEAPAVEPDFEILGLAERGVFLFAYSGREPALGEPAEALIGLGGGSDELAELPRVAMIWEPGGERSALPGEGLLDLVGRDPYEAAAAGWSVAALDADSLERARLLAPRLQPFTASAGDRLAWGVWLDFEGGFAELSKLVDRLAEVPIVSRRSIERWHDVRAALAPLVRRHSRLTLVVTEEPRAFRLRLQPEPDS